MEQTRLWAENASSDVLAQPNSLGHQPAQRPQPSPTATATRAIRRGLPSAKTFACAYQPTPTLMSACHANPVNEIDAGNGLSELP